VNIRMICWLVFCWYGPVMVLLVLLL
jgi:hypothetical protein